MSSSLTIAASSQGYNDNATYFTSFGGCLGSRATEADVQVPVRDAGVVSNLYTFASLNTASVNSTITLRVNLADAALTVTYAADQTGIKEDTSNTVTVAATDELDWEITIPTEAGTNTLTLRVISAQFAPTTSTNCVSFMVLSPATATLDDSAVSTTSFLPLDGQILSSATEAETKIRIGETFTSSNLYTYVTANSRTSDTVVRTRKNGADGGQSVTYTSGQTGVKEDTVNTDALVAGDDFNYSMTTGIGVGTISFTTICCRLVSTNNSFALVASLATGNAQAFNATNFLTVGGRLSSSSVEANFETLPRFTFTAKQLHTYVSVNTIAASATVYTVRDNRADSALTVSYAAAQTGLKSDTSNTAEFTSGTDEIAHKVVTPNTSGSITTIWAALIGFTAAAAARQRVHILEDS